MPIEMTLMEGPRIPMAKSTIAKQIIMNSWIHLDFLHRVGVSNKLSNVDTVRAKIKANERMFKYDA
jgi:hypothetical protein